MLNFDELLRVCPTESELKSKYRELARITHPDQNPSPTATTEMQALNAAYERAKLSLGSGSEQWSGSFEDIFDYWRQQGWTSDEPRTHSNTANGGYSWTDYDKDGKPYTAHSNNAAEGQKEERREKARESSRQNDRKKTPPPPKAEPLSDYEKRNCEFEAHWEKPTCARIIESYKVWSEGIRNGTSKLKPAVHYLLVNLLSCEGCDMQYDDKYLVITGNTYPHKDTIKLHGFQWDGELRMWWIAY